MRLAVTACLTQLASPAQGGTSVHAAPQGKSRGRLGGSIDSSQPKHSLSRCWGGWETASHPSKSGDYGGRGQGSTSGGG
eukprot:12478670-Ditylum_brightwellii.AAC.1